MIEKRASRPKPLWRVFALLCLCWAFAACGGRSVETALPSQSELEPDRLVILLHGYISESGAITPIFDLLNREGVPRAWLEPGAPGTAKYHTHSFDFSSFTRVGSDHNMGIEGLAEAFSHFYYSLPLSCPVCESRAERPVQVTLIARSFGGIVAREFLLREAASGRRVGPEVPGDGENELRWGVSRVVTLATPFFGSFKTLFARGFQTIVVNGVLRTVIMGFVNPEGGGVFGNVIDAQARALRYGSIFLWRQHIRWRSHVEQLAADGRHAPPWLVMTAIGHGDPARDGDGVTRFASANVAPNLSAARIETYVANIRHNQFFRAEEKGYIARELTLVSKAVVRFMEAGTLARDPSGAVAPWGLVDTEYGRRLAHLGSNGRPAQGVEGDVRQTFYFQPPPSPGAAETQVADLSRKMAQLTELFDADLGDVWLRFYDGFPDQGRVPRVLKLRRALSLFRNGVERSRSWSDLVAETEIDGDGDAVPVVQAMAPMRSHLITIPDVTPTGDYALGLTMAVRGHARAMPIPPEAVQLMIEGQQPSVQSSSMGPNHIPLRIEANQANLIHVYLDGDHLRRLYEGVREIDLREVSLIPAADLSKRR